VPSFFLLLPFFFVVFSWLGPTGAAGTVRLVPFLPDAAPSPSQALLGVGGFI
jgi:hypothetical protein